MFASSKSGAVADPKDTNFKNVTMLLHGNGTNGAQNNTFVDSSTNNFTITRNGNTTQGTFTPYGSNWSNYFDGSGDYLTCSSSATNFGTASFTIEFWVNFASLPSSGSNYNIISATVTNGVEVLYRGTGSYIEIGRYGVGPSLQYSWTPSIGSWNHVAFVRNGTTITIYINGTSVTSGTVSQDFQTGTTNIGSAGGSTSYFAGYLSNVRVVKSTAVYTSNFTPSTTPLTAISGTSLLTCADNRFIDDSTNAFAITVNGNTSVQRFSPFSPTTAYSTSVIGGSGYFDGSGDYLSTPGNTAFNFGSGNFTVEAWVYRTTSGAFTVISDVQYWYAFALRVDSNGAAYSYGFNSSTSSQNWYCISANSVVPVNAWCHLALVRNGSSIIVYANGVNVASTTFSGASAGTTSSVRIAHNDSAVEGTGYVTDARIVKGTAVYTSAFTPPTAPLTAITNTSLLLNLTNAGILDNAMMNDLETVGNAQISTSVKKYGSGSMYFDGTADYLKATNTLISNFGSGAFTVEAWVYFNSVSGTQVIAGNYQSSTVGWSLGKSGSTGYFYASFSGDGNDINGTTTVAINTWYHVAISGTPGATGLKLFVNGVQEGSTYTGAVSLDATTPLYISDLSGLGYGINGYIDDLRITKGYARYTSNFTAPTAAFADKG